MSTMLFSPRRLRKAFHSAALSIGLLPAFSGSCWAAAGPTSENSRKGGRPTVILDRLELPDVPNAAVYERHLRQVLRREARRADWGAGSASRIEYRFTVERLTLSTEGSVLKVSCAALGRLPKGKTAKSQLTYGGDPQKSREVVFRVLEIVARGVMTRLSQLERARRTEAR